MTYKISLKETLKVKKSKIDCFGVFAKRHIAEDEFIIRYRGRRLTSKAAQAEDVDTMYHFQLNSRYTIDGKNSARYLNHSCNPNCHTDIIKGTIWIIASRDIKPGEELTYNYGYNYSEAKDYPCLCRSKNCVGFISDESHWHKFIALSQN